MPRKQNNNHRVGGGHGTLYRRIIRRQECQERQKLRDQRTPQEQLKCLDEGNLTATKERARLERLINNPPKKKNHHRKGKK